MKQNSSPRWPPIIEFSRASWWVRLRDIFLTIAAWALFFYLIRNGLRLMVDYFSDPIFELTHTHPPDWVTIWSHLDDFLVVSTIAMLWLTLWGLIHRRRLQFAVRQPSPPLLPLAEHAARFDVDAAEAERRRQMKIAVVHFDAAHRVTDVVEGGGKIDQPQGTAI